MQFKSYLFISLIIHLSLFIFFSEFKNKERLKGRKIIPIEIINNKSFDSSKGNSNQNSLNTKGLKINDNNNELVKTKEYSNLDKELKSNDKEEILRGNFQINKNQIKKKINKRQDAKSETNKKKLNNKQISNSLEKGFSNKFDKKDIEKGSLKGNDKLKITCLNCVIPRYPIKALNKGLEGKPTVKVWILMNGNVEKAEIIISSGITSIDKAALEAAKKSKFYPISYKSFINIEYDLKLK